MAFTHAVIRAGGGIGFLPQWMAEEDVVAGRLVPVLPRHGQSSGHLYVVYPGGRHVPLKVTAFRDLLIEVLKSRST
jgi:DNA-binding transcriptional LysR family regulator